MFSEKNKKLFVINGFNYGFQKQLSGNMERWICTKRKCKSFLKINSLNNIEYLTYYYIIITYLLQPQLLLLTNTFIYIYVLIYYTEQHF
jgi:hypothetical protein